MYTYSRKSFARGLILFVCAISHFQVGPGRNKVLSTMRVRQATALCGSRISNIEQANVSAYGYSTLNSLASIAVVGFSKQRTGHFQFIQQSHNRFICMRNHREGTMMKWLAIFIQSLVKVPIWYYIGGLFPEFMLKRVWSISRTPCFVSDYWNRSMQDKLMRRTAMKDKSAPRDVRCSTAKHILGMARNSEAAAAFAVLIATTMFSVVLIWRIGIFKSGEWINSESSKAHIISGDLDALKREISFMPDLPLAVAFYSESCLHCKRMRDPFLQCSRDLDTVGFIAVNAEKSKDIVDWFKIRFVPTIVYIPSGHKLSDFRTYSGAADYSSLSRFLRKQ